MNLETGVMQIHIEDIIPNRFQPRLNFDEQGLKELSSSIKEHGIIQPLVLRKLGDKYEIIAGERRFKAAQMAGLTTVPAVIANIDDNKSAEVALVENVQRRDLTAIEEARSYKNLLDKGYLTQEELAKRMGLSQPAIANKLRLLNLDEEVQQALLEEKISERHARTLLGIEDKAVQREWLHKVINERLTVRQLDLELKKQNVIASSSKQANPANTRISKMTGMPSIEEMKSKAVDIKEANKMPSSIETLDVSPKTGTFINESVKKEDLNKEEKLNITAPNSIESLSTPMNPIQPNIPNGKFINLSGVNNIPPQPSEIKVPTLDANPESEFEIFDDGSTPTIEPPVIKKAEEKTGTSTMNMQSMQTDIELRPNNRFFVPVKEKAEQIDIQTQKDDIVDPMKAIDKITNSNPEKEKMELKDAIAEIRKKIEDLGNRGFFIDVEEIDFDSNYQITLRIYKD